ncbi:hypothetical protein Enr13x_38010 [Stieleria neptunia]|uniref:Uncharacterized protein n=1 Tax=Stieleria neptunia TaxID=2527979 RepID=A0A518HT19_9BACT|nr:hypothetical protein Enr13x_38010 [Stieleria neptunia]
MAYLDIRPKLRRILRPAQLAGDCDSLAMPLISYFVATVLGFG